MIEMVTMVKLFYHYFELIIEVFKLKCNFNKWTWKHWSLASTNGRAKKIISQTDSSAPVSCHWLSQGCSVGLEGKLKQTAQLFGRATMFTLFRGNQFTNGWLLTVFGYYTEISLKI